VSRAKLLKPLVTTSSGLGSRSERSPGASTGKDPAVEQSSPRIALAEGDIHPNDHLVVELVDGKETPQVVLIHWPWMKDTRCCRDKAVGQVSACDPAGRLALRSSTASWRGVFGRLSLADSAGARIIRSG
jgi:hypothetical protein